jgi:hypothetical protein
MICLLEYNCCTNENPTIRCATRNIVACPSFNLMVHRECNRVSTIALNAFLWQVCAHSSRCIAMPTPSPASDPMGSHARWQLSRLSTLCIKCISSWHQTYWNRKCLLLPNLISFARSPGTFVYHVMARHGAISRLRLTWWKFMLQQANLLRLQSFADPSCCENMHCNFHLVYVRNASNTRQPSLKCSASANVNSTFLLLPSPRRGRHFGSPHAFESYA